MAQRVREKKQKRRFAIICAKLLEGGLYGEIGGIIGLIKGDAKTIAYMSTRTSSQEGGIHYNGLPPRERPGPVCLITFPDGASPAQLNLA